MAKAPATPSAYLASIPAARRREVRRVHELIRKTVPGLRPVVRSGIIGYGPFHYRYASGREGDACRISVASNKNYISLYALAADDAGYVAERYKAKLPKASIGKSCVRFKRLSDLDERALAALIKQTAKTSFGDNEA